MENYTKTIMEKMEKASVEELKVIYLAYHLQKFKTNNSKKKYAESEKGQVAKKKFYEKRNESTVCTCGKTVRNYYMKHHLKTKYHQKYHNNPRVVLDEYSFIGEQI